MQKGVHAKFVDMSTSVREAAVELIGRFVLNKPELILQYYDMIIERILVSSLSLKTCTRCGVNCVARVLGKLMSLIYM